MTEEQKQWVCDKAGVEYDKGYSNGTNYGYRQETKIDLNILMQAVENINQNIKHTFVLILGNCVCVEMHFPANMVKAQHREYFDYNQKIPLAEAIKQALIYIKEND